MVEDYKQYSGILIKSATRFLKRNFKWQLYLLNVDDDDDDDDDNNNNSNNNNGLSQEYMYKYPA
jgi:hypothetical protein